jgi:hypothetical protein
VLSVLHTPLHPFGTPILKSALVELTSLRPTVWFLVSSIELWSRYVLIHMQRCVDSWMRTVIARAQKKARESNVMHVAHSLSTIWQHVPLGWTLKPSDYTHFEISIHVWDIFASLGKIMLHNTRTNSLGKTKIVWNFVYKLIINSNNFRTYRLQLTNTD